MSALGHIEPAREVLKPDSIECELCYRPDVCDDVCRPGDTCKCSCGGCQQTVFAPANGSLTAYLGGSANEPCANCAFTYGRHRADGQCPFPDGTL